MDSNFKRCNWGDYNSFSNKIKGILKIRMNFGGTAEERRILKTIWESLKDGNEYGGNKREQFKSGRGRNQYDDFNRSHGSYRPGGSSYDSGHKGKSYGDQVARTMVQDQKRKAVEQKLLNVNWMTTLF